MAGYTWPDGSRGHTISWGTHLQHVAAKGGNPAVFGALNGQPLSAFTPAAARIVAGNAGLPASTGLPGNTAPPPPGTPAPLPVNPALDQAIGSITAGRDSAISGLEAQKPQVLADYGYKAAGYDANGAPTGLAFDPSNPYSRASLLLKSYNNQQRGTTNQMASAGQLYSGAYRHQQGLNQNAYNVSNDALIKALTRLLVGIQGQEQSTRNNADLSIAQARGQYMPTS